MEPPHWCRADPLLHCPLRGKPEGSTLLHHTHLVSKERGGGQGVLSGPGKDGKGCLPDVSSTPLSQKPCSTAKNSIKHHKKSLIMLASELVHVILESEEGKSLILILVSEISESNVLKQILFRVWGSDFWIFFPEQSYKIYHIYLKGGDKEMDPKSVCYCSSLKRWM